MTWQELLARDLMKTQLVTVSANTPVQEVERVLAEHRIGGVPVTDAAGHLTGLVSLRDVVEFRAEDDDRRPERDEEESTATAADLMTGSVYSVDVKTPIQEVAAEMVKRGIHRVLVSEKGHHVGLISTFDILQQVAEA